jgi:hypothetical protein
MVPDTCFKSGPAVVVKRAERAFSGRSDLRSAVRPAVEAALSSGSALASTGISMPKSAMIWSAVRRRSLDLSGESGLIWGFLAFVPPCDYIEMVYIWLLLEHVGVVYVNFERWMWRRSWFYMCNI